MSLVCISSRVEEKYFVSCCISGSVEKEVLLPAFLAVWRRKPVVSCLYFWQFGGETLLSLVCISSSVEEEAFCLLPIYLAVWRRKPVVSFLYVWQFGG